jgi:mRNA interferase MazF
MRLRARHLTQRTLHESRRRLCPKPEDKRCNRAAESRLRPRKRKRTRSNFERTSSTCSASREAPLVIKRGDLWWAELPEPRCSEPGFRRPVLVVQSNAFSESRIRTVLVVIITSTMELAEAPGNVRLPKKSSGLKSDSVANISQVFTLDKTFLRAKIGTLPPALLRKVSEGLRLVFALEES